AREDARTDHARGVEGGARRGSADADGERGPVGGAGATATRHVAALDAPLDDRAASRPAPAPATYPRARRRRDAPRYVTLLVATLDYEADAVADVPRDLPELFAAVTGSATERVTA